MQLVRYQLGGGGGGVKALASTSTKNASFYEHPVPKSPFARFVTGGSAADLGRGFTIRIYGN